MVAKQQVLLSAFIDGELDENELEQLISLLNEGRLSRADFVRYQYQSDVMHGYCTGQSFVDMSRSVASALEKEATHQLPVLTKQKTGLIRIPGWLWRQAAGLAVAASLGGLAVLIVIDGNSLQHSTIQPRVEVESTTVYPSANRWTVSETEVEDRLKDYLVDHNEYVGTPGIFSYARMVSYGEE